MANIFKNGNLWWIRVRDPRDGTIRRLSLSTPSETRAQLLLRKWEATTQLIFLGQMEVELPPRLAEMLPEPSLAVTPVAPVTRIAEVAISSISQQSLATVIREFADHCRSENAAHNAEGKESILKAAFGPNCLSVPPKLDGPLAAGTLAEILPAAVEAFINGRRNRHEEPLARKTKRHYREVFVQLYNFALRRSYYLPTNVAFPNPMGALPGWNDQAGEIVYLTREEVAVQLKALEATPVLQACVATMIYSGPRRAETLWLRRESLRTSPQGSRYFSIRAVRDETHRKQTLKTSGSARAVPFCQELTVILDDYLLHHRSDWLFPAPRGGRWDKDHFSQTLAKANAAAGLSLTAGHYRHTYATHLASEGCSVFALAKYMGTSVAMIMRHYAAFLSPDAVR